MHADSGSDGLQRRAAGCACSVQKLIVKRNMTIFENAQEAYSRLEQGVEGKVILRWD